MLKRSKVALRPAGAHAREVVPTACPLSLLLLAGLIAAAAAAAPSLPSQDPQLVVVTDLPGLSQAIILANSRQADSPRLALQLHGVIEVTTELPAVAAPLIIQGRPGNEGRDGLICDRNGVRQRALAVASGGFLLQDVTVSGCNDTALVIDVDATLPAASSAAIVFQRVVFRTNRGISAGAVEIRTTFGPANVTFDACVFVGNELLPRVSDVFARGAAAIYGGPGAYSLLDCEFFDNGGGSLALLSASRTIRFCAACMLPNSTMAVFFDWSRRPATWQAVQQSQRRSTPCTRHAFNANGALAESSDSAASLAEAAGTLCHQEVHLKLEILGCTFFNNTASGSTRVAMTRPEYSVAAGVLSVQTGIVDADSCAIDVRDSSFLDNLGDSFAVYGDVGTARCGLAFRNATFAENTGLATGSDWPTGGTLNILTQASLTFESSNMTNNIRSNAAMRLVQIQTVVINDSRISGNQVAWSGAISANNLDNLLLDSCVFYGNNANLRAGALELFGMTHSVIQNCSFLNNGASDGGAIWVDNSNLVMKGCSLRGNVACWGTGAMMVINGRYTSISDTNFTDNLAFYGGGLILSTAMAYQSTLITNCLFDGNTAKSGAGVIVNDNRHPVVFQGCTFRNNSVLRLPFEPKYNAPNIVNSPSDWMWFNSDSEMYNMRLMLSMRACSRFGGGGMCVTATAPVVLDGCVFTNNQAMYGGALNIQMGRACAFNVDCFTMVIVNTKFADNLADGGGGGAIFSQVDSLLSIHCDATTQGGHSDALLNGQPIVTGSSGVPGLISVDKLPCSSWSGNMAFDNGYGDVIATSALSLALMTPSYFPAYRSGTPLLITVEAVDLYGQRVAATEAPLSVIAHPVFVPTRVVDVTTQATSECALYAQVDADQELGTVSFSDLRLRFTTGRCAVTLETTAFSGSLSYQLQTQTVITQVNDCDLDQVTSPQRNECYDCSAGFYSLDPATGACLPCVAGASCSQPLELNATGNGSGGGPPFCGLVAEAVKQLEAAAAAATVAEDVADGGGDREVDGAIPVVGVIVPLDGYWHSHPYSTQLHACRTRAACVWRGRDVALAAVQSALVHGALPMVSPLEYQAAQCAVGYTGNLCGQCAPGYGRNPRAAGACESCLPKPVNTFVYCMISLLSLAVVTLLLTSAGVTAKWVDATRRALATRDVLVAASISAASPSASRHHNGSSGGSMVGSVAAATTAAALRASYIDHRVVMAAWPQHCTALKIMVTYLQVLSIFRKVPARWPACVQVFFSVTSRLSSMAWGIASLECSWSIDPSWSRAASTVVIVVLSPLYTSVALLLFWLAAVAWLSWRGHQFDSIPRYIASRFFLSCAVVLFFCYPSVATAVLSVFSCRTLDVPDGATAAAASLDLGYQYTAEMLHSVGSFWRNDLDVQCYTGQHLTLVWAVGIPGLLLYVVGVPLLAAVVVYRSRAALHPAKAATAARSGLARRQQLKRLATGEVAAAPADAAPDVPGMVFTDAAVFLFQGYTMQTSWWESLVMLRKLALIAVATFLQSNSGLSIMLLQGILAMALLVELKVRPLASSRMHVLQRLEIFAVIGTLYVSLLFTFVTSYDLRTALGVLLVLGNCGVLLYMAYRSACEVHHVMYRSSGFHLSLTAISTTTSAIEADDKADVRRPQGGGKSHSNNVRLGDLTSVSTFGGHTLPSAKARHCYPPSSPSNSSRGGGGGGGWGGGSKGNNICHSSPSHSGSSFESALYWRFHTDLTDGSPQRASVDRGGDAVTVSNSSFNSTSRSSLANPAFGGSSGPLLQVPPPLPPLAPPPLHELSDSIMTTSARSQPASPTFLKFSIGRTFDAIVDSSGPPPSVPPTVAHLRGGGGSSSAAAAAAVASAGGVGGSHSMRRTLTAARRPPFGSRHSVDAAPLPSASPLSSSASSRTVFRDGEGGGHPLSPALLPYVFALPAALSGGTPNAVPSVSSPSVPPAAAPARPAPYIFVPPAPLFSVTAAPAVSPAPSASTPPAAAPYVFVPPATNFVPPAATSAFVPPGTPACVLPARSAGVVAAGSTVGLGGPQADNESDEEADVGVNFLEFGRMLLPTAWTTTAQEEQGDKA